MYLSELILTTLFFTKHGIDSYVTPCSQSGSSFGCKTTKGFKAHRRTKLPAPSPNKHPLWASSLPSDGFNNCSVFTCLTVASSLAREREGGNIWIICVGSWSGLNMKTLIKIVSCCLIIFQLSDGRKFRGNRAGGGELYFTFKILSSFPCLHVFFPLFYFAEDKRIYL